MRESLQMFGSFPETRWSLVARAGHASLGVKRQALAELLERYRPAFMRFLVKTKRIDLDRAEDLVQGFLTARVLERNLIARAEQARGRFRAFLVKALQNYAIDELRMHRDAEVDIDEHRDAAPTGEQAVEFDVAWARQVLATAYDVMKAECERSGRTHIWEVFENRVITPTIEATRPPSYDELASRYGFRSPKEAGNIFVSGRRMFERVLRGVIGEYADETEIDREIGDLVEILSCAPRA